MMKKAIIVILVLIACGAGFFGGMKYQQGKRSTFLGQFNGRQGMRPSQGQLGGNRQSFRPVSGEIIGSDDKSITVKLPDGSNKIILLSETTTINKAAEATKGDLGNGEEVMVFGQENPDGSVTASSVQIGTTTPVPHQ